MANQLLTLLAPVLSAPLTTLQMSLTSLIANPTIENATAQFEGLALDALNPLALEGVSIQAAAQEALHLVVSLQGVLTATTTTVAPTSTPTPGAISAA